MHYKLDKKKDAGRKGKNVIKFLHNWSVNSYKHEQKLRDFAGSEFPLKQFSMCACRGTESFCLHLYLSQSPPFLTSLCRCSGGPNRSGKSSAGGPSFCSVG